MKNNLISEIKSKLNIFSPTQRNIAKYILSHTDKVVLLSISDLAMECSTSETTVMRFLKKLGYSSFQVFKVEMAQQISVKSPQAVYEDIKLDDDVSKVKQKIIYSVNNSINELNNLLNNETLNEVVNTLSNANKILFFGIGGSSLIAQDAFHKFLRLGLNVLYDTSPHLMNVHCTYTSKKDVLLLVSHSGESREVLECANLARKNNAKIIALTSYKTSSLTKLVDFTLLSSSNESKYHTDAMVSRIIQLVIIDTIYVALVLKMGNKSIDNINKSRMAVAKSKT